MAEPPSPPPLVYLVAKVNIRGRAGWLSSHLGPPSPPPPVSQRQRPNCHQRPDFPSAATVVNSWSHCCRFYTEYSPKKLLHLPISASNFVNVGPLNLKQNLFTTINIVTNMLKITFCSCTLLIICFITFDLIRKGWGNLSVIVSFLQLAKKIKQVKNRPRFER